MKIKISKELLTEARKGPKAPIIGFTRDAEGNPVAVRATWENSQPSTAKRTTWSHQPQLAATSRKLVDGAASSTPQMKWLFALKQGHNYGAASSVASEQRLGRANYDAYEEAGEMVANLFRTAQGNVNAKLKIFADQYGAEVAFKMVGLDPNNVAGGVDILGNEFDVAEWEYYRDKPDISSPVKRRRVKQGNLNGNFIAETIELHTGTKIGSN